MSSKYCYRVIAPPMRPAIVEMTAPKAASKPPMTPMANPTVVLETEKEK